MLAMRGKPGRRPGFPIRDRQQRRLGRGQGLRIFGEVSFQRVEFGALARRGPRSRSSRAAWGAERPDQIAPTGPARETGRGVLSPTGHAPAASATSLRTRIARSIHKTLPVLRPKRTGRGCACEAGGIAKHPHARRDGLSVFGRPPQHQRVHASAGSVDVALQAAGPHTIPRGSISARAIVRQRAVGYHASVLIFQSDFRSGEGDRRGGLDGERPADLQARRGEQLAPMRNRDRTRSADFETHLACGIQAQVVDEKAIGHVGAGVAELRHDPQSFDPGSWRRGAARGIAELGGRDLDRVPLRARFDRDAGAIALRIGPGETDFQNISRTGEIQAIGKREAACGSGPQIERPDEAEPFLTGAIGLHHPHQRAACGRPESYRGRQRRIVSDVLHRRIAGELPEIGAFEILAPRIGRDGGLRRTGRNTRKRKHNDQENDGFISHGHLLPVSASRAGGAGESRSRSR